MRVIRSAGQNVSPSDDGRLYDQIFEDGLFEDATITSLGTNNVSISALYGIICGRDFTAEAQTITVTLPESDTATGYIYVEIDTSADNILSIGSALSPFTPTYEDINTNGAVAQMVLAEYTASTVAVTDITPVYYLTSGGGIKPGSIAAIETSPATSNHSVGDYIVYGGTLYKVTTAITAGESLVVGTNITTAVLTDDLTKVYKNEETLTMSQYGTEALDLDATNYILLGVNGTAPSQPNGIWFRVAVNSSMKYVIMAFRLDNNQTIPNQVVNIWYSYIDR